MNINVFNTTKKSTLKALKMVAVVLCSSLVSQLSIASSSMTEKKQIKFLKGQISTNFSGKISPKEDGHNYIFYGKKGQYTVINLSAYPKKGDEKLELANVGVLISPSGVQDGTKGGIIYQGCLPESGKYNLRISANNMLSNGGTAGYQAELIILPDLCE